VTTSLEFRDEPWRKNKIPQSKPFGELLDDFFGRSISAASDSFFFCMGAQLPANKKDMHHEIPTKCRFTG